MTRKSPRRHRVKTHKRGGKQVNSFSRGKGNSVIFSKRRIKSSKSTSVLTKKFSNDELQVIDTLFALGGTVHESGSDEYSRKAILYLEEHGFLERSTIYPDSLKLTRKGKEVAKIREDSGKSYDWFEREEDSRRKRIALREQEAKKMVYWVYGPGPYVGNKKWYSGPYDTYQEALDSSAGHDKVVKRRKDWEPPEED